MSTGFAIAIRAAPFFDLLDQEEESLAAQLIETSSASPSSATVAMDTSRRRLAQGVDAFVRSLPTTIRNDASTSRTAAYALVGLADERMLHHPAGGLDSWRERLLEFELYGSALAGQEIVSLARASTYGTAENVGSRPGGDAALLAPLYLGVFRAGFEGSLRGDTLGLTSLIASLEESVGAGRDRSTEIAADVRPTRIGLSPLPLALVGLCIWLVSGLAVWLVLPRDSLEEASKIAERVSAGLPVVDGAFDPLNRSVGPSNLPPLDNLLLLDGEAASRDDSSLGVIGAESSGRPITSGDGSKRVR